MPQSVVTNTLSQESAQVDTNSNDSAAISSSFQFTDSQDSSNGAIDSAENKSLNGPGVFKNHLLKPVNPNARPLNDTISDWLTISLIVMMVFFTWFRLFYYKIFRQLLTSYFNMTASNQIVRDESYLLQRASLVISIISYLLGGLFLYQISVLFDWQIYWLQKGLVRFVLFSLIIAISYSVKMILLRVLSVIFNQEKAAGTYIFNLFLMIMMAGLILFPANIFLAYSNASVKHFAAIATIVLISLMFLFRLSRAIRIWFSIPQFSFFYLFLYLCAFEVAPLLVVWKLSFG
ncbi:MAG: hypothetical protein RI952_1447 [Bacteroidota bacterium]|jgi:hypothetical protein